MTGAAPPRLLVATTNRGKLAEIRDILGGTPTVLGTLDDHPGLAEPEETGATFAANARLKACYYAGATGEFTVAEDSGLEIDALDGAPGVRSARFNGASYADKFAAIRRLLAERGADGSAARFVCALALASPDGSAGHPTNPPGARAVPERELLTRPAGILWETAGVVEGRVQFPPRGDGGFGYDPIFHYPPYGRTLAEVTPAEKAAVSHRGQAFRRLRRYLAGPR